MALEEIDVLYFVEHKDRELAIAESMAAHLYRKYGLTVVVVSQVFDATVSLFKYIPKIVVTPTTAFSIGSPGWMFYQLYGKQIQYLSLNYEQLLGSWEGSSKMVFSEITKEYQHHFAWGDGFVDILVNQKVLRKNIQITGRPLSMLIKKEYSNNRDSIKKLITDFHDLRSDSKIFFFALTDGIAFCSLRTINSVSSRGFPKEKILEISQYILITIHTLINWMAELSQELQENSFIVLRPHPSVSVQEYEKLFYEILGYVPKNLIITKTFNAQQWLASSDLYFTNYSTLLLDSDSLAVPSVILDFPENGLENHNNIENYWWCKGRDKVASFQELREVINSDYKYEKQCIDKEGYIDQAEDSISLSCYYINQYVAQGKTFPPKANLNYFKVILKSPRRVIGNLVRKLLISSNIKFFSSLVKRGITYDYFKPIRYRS